jgi:hypothetical protein
MRIGLMKRGVSLLLMLVAASVSAVAQKPPGAGDQDAAQQPLAAPTNPALLYWQAIAMLPVVSAAEIKLISDVLDGEVKPEDVRVEGLLERTRKSLDRFGRAAASPAPCVWGTTFDEGPFAPMPHLPKLQLLCRLALMRSSSKFAEGRPEEGLQWILHVHHAARHAAADRLLTTFVMQHAIEQQAIRATAKHVMRLEATTRERHLQSLKTLGPPSLLRDALDGERAVSEYLMRMVVGMEAVAVDEKVLLDAAQNS